MILVHFPGSHHAAERRAAQIELHLTDARKWRPSLAPKLQRRGSLAEHQYIATAQPQHRRVSAISSEFPQCRCA
jgi:hypothetical protein